ncbi:hypothetical protein ABT288_43140 [Streptomyces sp. NPDC001093]|uniref:hypothetical protein n=1 Tax=Streptomyces sp. NPDC001093 TaxID=3154376 RepID=UPI003327C73F
MTAGSALLAQLAHEAAGAAARDGGVPDRAAQCTAAARVPRPTGHLVRLAVLADRQTGAGWPEAGAGWPQTGRAPSISGEATRARSIRRGTAEGPPGPRDVPAR